MKLRKTIKKMAALGVGASLVGATLLGATAAADQLSAVRRYSKGAYVMKVD